MATYDVLSIYPEGKLCDCCQQKIKNKFFITITGRTVCSYNCKNNLKPSPQDSCYICKKPVWEGVCYATRTKYLCSDKCKDAYLKEREQNILNNGKGKYNSANIDENLVSLKIKYGSPFTAAQIKKNNYHQ